jgi:hypothetical protein
MARIAHLSLSLALVCLTAATAAADPIVVTSGFLTATRSEGGVVSIQGTRGFSLQGRVDPWEGRVDPLMCSPCIPSVPMSIAANLSGSVFSGVATLDGETYSNIWGVNAPASLFIEIFGGSLVPAFRDEPTTFRTPFTAEGFFFLPFPGEPVPLMATGFGSVLLTPNPLSEGDPRNWTMDSIRYDFGAKLAEPSAVPEPATLVLVGGGLLALVRRRRRQGL